MTSVSPLQTLIVPDAAAATAASSAEDGSLTGLAFQDLLGAAGKETDDSVPSERPREKEQLLSLSVIAAIFTSIPTIVPAGDFGVASAGDEAGAPQSSHAAITPDAVSNETAEMTPEPTVEVPVPIGGAPEIAVPSELAFALRLTDTIEPSAPQVTDVAVSVKASAQKIGADIAVAPRTEDPIVIRVDKPIDTVASKPSPESFVSARLAVQQPQALAAERPAEFARTTPVVEAPVALPVETQREVSRTAISQPPLETVPPVKVQDFPRERPAKDAPILLEVEKAPVKKVASSATPNAAIPATSGDERSTETPQLVRREIVSKSTPPETNNDVPPSAAPLETTESKASEVSAKAPASQKPTVESTAPLPKAFTPLVVVHDDAPPEGTPSVPASPGTESSATDTSIKNLPSEKADTSHVTKERTAAQAAPQPLPAASTGERTKVSEPERSVKKDFSSAQDSRPALDSRIAPDKTTSQPVERDAPTVQTRTDALPAPQDTIREPQPAEPASPAKIEARPKLELRDTAPSTPAKAVAPHIQAAVDTDPQTSGGDNTPKDSHALKVSAPKPAKEETPQPGLSVESAVAKDSTLPTHPDSSASLPFSAQPQRESSEHSAPATRSAPIAEPAGAATAPEPRATPQREVTELNVTVPGPRAETSAAERIDIRMVQRAGEIHVAVRTPDPQTAHEMRQDLSRLATSLGEAGFHTDAWRPGAEHVTATSAPDRGGDFQQDTRQNTSADPDSQSGSRDGQNSGQQRRQQRDEQPRWVAELEKHGS